MASSEGSNTAAPTAFQIHADDNVATLLDAAETGPVIVRGCGAERIVMTLDHIAQGHKMAVESIETGQPVIKYGVIIGMASTTIDQGAWVHLHNCRSQMDERSGGFDVHTGLPEDTKYE
jgi:altronate dehydratase small subunit